MHLFLKFKLFVDSMEGIFVFFFANIEEISIIHNRKIASFDVMAFPGENEFHLWDVGTF